MRHEYEIGICRIYERVLGRLGNRRTLKSLSIAKEMIIIEILIEHQHGIIHSYLLLLQRDIWINALENFKIFKL